MCIRDSSKTGAPPSNPSKVTHPEFLSLMHSDQNSFMEPSSTNASAMLNPGQSPTVYTKLQPMPEYKEKVILNSKSTAKAHFKSKEDVKVVQMPISKERVESSSDPMTHLKVAAPVVKSTTDLKSIFRAESKCTKEHFFQWSDSATGYVHEMFICDNCKKNNYCSNSHWTCSNCLYELCSTCSSLPKPVRSANIKCLKRHSIQLIPDSTTSGIVPCNYCKGTIQCAAAHWTCIPCSFNVCQSCFALLKGRADSGELSKPARGVNPTNSFECWIMHGKYWDTEVYECKVALCTRCRRPINCSEGRWRCGTCKHEYCEVCKLPPY
eukprot:TRINITY_DN11499_c0_g2_i2.p1 TRINITY_DN11499_c0_g2~~TRINITY_DN11499_c0_g2_i2.p1  ORF type:complete len:338 (+),score=22.91 TRINITY_DN11499_c0_g2_i2:47-1015(+)